MRSDKETIDYIHDTLIDLLISCMRSGYMPHDKAEIGDWCIEISNFNINKNRDECIGKLIKVDDENDIKSIETIGGKIVNWSNAIIIKIPNKYMRC